MNPLIVSKLDAVHSLLGHDEKLFERMIRDHNLRPIEGQPGKKGAKYRVAAIQKILTEMEISNSET